MAILCKQVLLVEDSPPFRRFVSNALKNCSHELQIVGEVSDGLAAIQHAQDLQPDLVLLDIGLPKLNGIEAARVIRERSPRSKILFLTQESSDDVVQAALSTGAEGYVLKMSAGRELIPALSALFLGQRFISSAVRQHAQASRNDDEIWHSALPTTA